MAAAGWLGRAATAVWMAAAAGCSMAPKAGGESDLLAEYRAAHEGRDLQGALRLVHWDVSTRRDRGEITKMFEGLFQRRLREVRVERSGTGSASLIVECEGTLMQWVFPIEILGGRYYLAFRLPP